MSTGIIASNLTFAYGSRPVLHGLSLALAPGKLIGIVGPNGCGKSTFVSLLARLRRPSGGQVTLDGRALESYHRSELARRVAFLPQNPATPRGITVAQVLRYGRHPHQSLFRQFSREDAARIGDISRRLDLEAVMERPMEELSGGQRQRAWLGMTLVQDTPYVLLDEPTSALDIGHQHEVLECIRAMRDEGKTVVMVIHDLTAAARFCDWLVALKDGKLHRQGTPREVMTSDVVGDLYDVPVEVVEAGSDRSPVVVPRRRPEQGSAP